MLICVWLSLYSWLAMCCSLCMNFNSYILISIHPPYLPSTPLPCTETVWTCTENIFLDRFSFARSRAWSPPAPARLRSKTVKYQLLTHEHWGRWHLWRFYHRTRSSIRSRFPPPGPSASRGKHNTKGSFKPLSVLKRSCKFKAKWAPKCVPPLFSVIK